MRRSHAEGSAARHAAMRLARWVVPIATAAIVAVTVPVEAAGSGSSVPCPTFDGPPAAPSPAGAPSSPVLPRGPGPNQDIFGWSVSIDGSTALVGAPGQEAAYIFTRSASTWTREAKLTPSGGQRGDVFGWSVSISGNTAVVGAIFANNGTGAAYVFVRSAAGWVQQARLTASDATAGDIFGYSAGTSGGTVVIGAPDHNVLGGAAYVFQASGTSWVQRAKLTSPDGGYLGYSVATSGATVVAGEPFDTSNSEGGSAYVFDEGPTGWAKSAKLVPSGIAPIDNAGWSVALSPTGRTAVLGAPQTNSNTGVAYVFADGGSGWAQTAKLSAGDGATGDCFGWSVSVPDDSGPVLVGAPFKDNDRGAAYLFEPPGNGGTWSQHAKLAAVGGADGDLFGRSLSMSSSTALIGAPTGGTGSGHAYPFQQSAGVWMPETPLAGL